MRKTRTKKERDDWRAGYVSSRDEIKRTKLTPEQAASVLEGRRRARMRSRNEFEKGWVTALRKHASSEAL